MKKLFNGIFGGFGSFSDFIKEMRHRYCSYIDEQKKGSFFCDARSRHYNLKFYLKHSSEERQQIYDREWENAHYILNHWDEIELEKKAQLERAKAMRARKKQKKFKRKK